MPPGKKIISSCYLVIILGFNSEILEMYALIMSIFEESRHIIRVAVGIEFQFPSHSHRISVGIPIGFPWEFPQDSHRISHRIAIGIPTGFPIGFPTGLP